MTATSPDTYSESPGGTGGLSFSAAFPHLLLMTGLFYINFMARISLAPLLPSIQPDLGFSHVESGALFLLISGGYFLGIIFSGFVSSRVGHRKSIIFSAMAVGLCLIGISVSNSLTALRGGVLLMGAASGLYLPSGIAALTSLIRPKDWGKAIAVHELAPNLSFMTLPIVCEILLVYFPWRGIIGLLGLTSVCAGIAFAFLGKGGDFPGQAPSIGVFRTLFSVPSFWLMAALFSLGITGSVGIFSMLPLYLVAERGMERNRANTLIALSRLLGLFMVFMAGWANDRFGPRSTLVSVMGLTGMTTILMALASGKILAASLFTQAMASVCFFPPAFAALAQVGPSETRNVSVSLTVPAGFLLGAGVAPVTLGAMGDAWSFSIGIGILGFLILLGMLPAAGLDFTPRSNTPKNR